MTMKPLSACFLALSALTLPSCSLAPDLAERPPALRDMEEPLDLRAEPSDEAARAAMPAGSFSGLYVKDARETLEAKLNDPEAVVIERVVENSPADRAGLAPGDLLLEVELDGGAPREIATPSQWRQLELTASPGSKLALVVDRAGREAETELTLVARVRPAGREATDRYREEQRVGVVVRTATEVEARSAGLGPGAGAVIVGMSQKSPWRRAGLQFGDLIVAVGGAELTHPQQLLNQIREAGGDRLSLAYVRGGQRAEVDAALTTRSSTLRELSVPPLFSYEADRGQSEWSALLGLVHYRSTAAAWRFRLLWVIAIRSGDADELQEPGA